MTKSDKIGKKRILGLEEMPEVSEKTPENRVKCCVENVGNKPYRNIYAYLEELEVRVKDLEDAKGQGFAIIAAANVRITVLEGLVEALKGLIEELVTRRKVDELTGKGERYETKLLNVKPHISDSIDEKGNPIKAEPVKPEHITVKELFQEVKIDEEINKLSSSKKENKEEK